MKCLVVAAALLAVAVAEPGFASVAHHVPLAYSAHAVAHHPLAVAPGVTQTQYHAQDELGQYTYGYAGGPSAKHETRTFDGITRGGYSYLDANGIIQSASYVSDPINGFRVAATNIPQGPAPVVASPVAVAPVAVGAPLPVVDTPEVVAARAAHFQAVAEARSRVGLRKKRSPGLLSAPVALSAPARFAYSVSAPAYSTPLAYSHAVAAPVAYSTHSVAAPVAYSAHAAAPFAYSTHAVASPVAYSNHAVASPVAYSTHAVAAPAVAAYSAPVAVAQGVTQTQHHAQDELGQYSYGYSNPLSTKHEVRTFDGITQGGYSYVDSNGLVQSVNYVADPVNGFRAAGTNFP